MDRCQRCYADDRTQYQITVGVPHYCKGPRVRGRAPPPTLDYSPPTASAPIQESGPRTVWDGVFANSELNRHGIPKHLEDSPRFSYDNSPYFKRPKYGLAALKEQDGSQEAGKAGGQETAKAPGSGGNGDHMEIDMLQRPKAQEGADRDERLAEDADDVAVNEEAPARVEDTSHTTTEQLETVDDTGKSAEEVKEATSDPTADTSK